MYLHESQVRLLVSMIIPVGQSHLTLVPSPSELGTEKQKISHPPLLTAHPLEDAARADKIDMCTCTDSVHITYYHGEYTVCG